MRLSEFFENLRTRAADKEEELIGPLLRTRASSHNGYIREKALREIVNSPSFDDWPIVLERLNDWVP